MLRCVVSLIHWRDPALRPGILHHVPPGFEAVTDLDVARQLIAAHIEAAGLPPRRAEHFSALWLAWLERGMQPSGLVLSRLAGLTDVVGHTSTGTVRRWAQFCQRRPLTVNVPGKLHPPRSPGSGERTRAFLVVRRDCGRLTA